MSAHDTQRAQRPCGHADLREVVTLPPPGPGFIGEGHTAIHVIDAQEFAHNDPFIMLADDRVDLSPGTPCRWSASACRL